MRVIKWIFGLLFLVLILAVAAVAIFVATFDANSYKEKIIQTVKDETGRDLSLNGELKASFYPWLGVELSDAELSNAEGFSADKFLTVEQASIRLQLMPLIKKNVVADRIQLNGVDVWLERNAQGTSNWDDIQERFKSPESSNTPSSSSNSDGLTGSIAGFSLQNANLQWVDALNKQDIALTIKEFSTGQLKAGVETTIDSEFSFELKEPVIQGQVKLKGKTKLSDLENFVFSDPVISLDIQGLDAQAENIHADIDVTDIRYIQGELVLSNPEIQIDITNMPSLAKQADIIIKGTTLTYKDDALSLPKADIKVELQGSALPGDSLQSALQAERLSFANKTLGLESFNLNGTAKGDSLPEKELSAQLAAPSLSLSLETNKVFLQDFVAKVFELDIRGSVTGKNIVDDNLSLTGNIKLAEFSPKELAARLEIELPEMSDEAWTQAKLDANFTASKNSASLTEMTAFIDGTKWLGRAALTDLKAKKITFDLSAESLDANRLIPPKQADALQDKQSSAAKDAAINAIVIPQAPLKEWDAKGSLKVGKMTVANIITTDLEAGINLLDGKLRVFPSKAGFFGGQYSGDIRLDVSGDVPRLQTAENITGIDLAAMGDALWAEQMMTGSTTGRITIDTRGKTVGEMRANALGDLDLKVNDGVLQGFDLNYAVANALALLRRETNEAVDTKQTAFKQLSATANVAQGLLKNEDFLAVMPRMRIRGNGQLNLSSNEINYSVNADILESKSAVSGSSAELSLDELVGASIPVKITGTLFEPKIRPDVAGYIRKKTEDRVKEELEDKIKDKLGDKLGGLFGGARNEPAPVETPAEEPISQNPEDQASPETEDPSQEPEVKPEEVDPVEQKKNELEQKAKDRLKDLFGK